MVGKALLYTGIALIVASVIRATIYLLRVDPFDLWSLGFAAGCILASIGLGVTKSVPWEKIKGKKI